MVLQQTALKPRNLFSPSFESSYMRLEEQVLTQRVGAAAEHGRSDPSLGFGERAHPEVVLCTACVYHRVKRGQFTGAIHRK